MMLYKLTLTQARIEQQHCSQRNKHCSKVHLMLYKRLQNAFIDLQSQRYQGIEIQECLLICCCLPLD